MRLRYWLIGLVAIGATAAGALPQRSSMPDVGRLHSQRSNCHGAYDTLIEEAKAGASLSDAEYAFGEAYEAAALAGQPCPTAPEGLGTRAVNRTVTQGEAYNRIVKYMEKDDPVAYYEAGIGAIAGKAPGVDQAGGVEFVKKAAELGDVEAKFMMARLHLGGSFGKANDHAGAFPFLQAAAQGGHVDALSILALNYYEGSDVVKKDHKTAFGLFRHAAERGHVYATYMAAWMANNGEGTRKDHELAYRLSRNLVDQGEVAGAVLAASALMYQDDRRKHEHEILYWMDVAIRDGDAKVKDAIGKLRPQVASFFERINAPPQYRPRERKVCPMKTVCYVNSFTNSRSCTTNKDYWSDCDG